MIHKKLPKCSTWLSVILNLFLLGITILLANHMLEFSTYIKYQFTYAHYTETLPRYILLGPATLSILFFVLYMLCNRVWLTSLLGSLICGILAIINYYVIQFHGTPLSFTTLRNWRAAFNVLHAYEFTLDPPVFTILGILAVCVLLCCLAGLFTKPILLTGKKRLICNLCLVLLWSCVFYVGYLGSNPIKPANTMSWRWKKSYLRYGYIPCTIESYFNVKNIVTKPEGYSPEILEAMEMPPPAENEGTAQPDIILILNETFYDPALIADIDADDDYLKNIHALDNCLSGYAVIPSIGGGTNSSEYELLTSNLLELMPGITPFNVLDLRGANSIVSHLNSLGYNSTGSHNGSKSNYNRNAGYPALGFHESYFSTDFTEPEYFHNRHFQTDASAYRQLYTFYEKAPASGPRFQYLLTIQNHAGYDDNDPQHDIVHTRKDYGENTQLLNEYLSCLSLSDSAFKGLTDYFSRQERPVIVCMMGDHAPSFASSIVDPKYSDEEQELLLRSVPLLIWANFPLPAQELGTMSSAFVVPTLLELAGTELTPYYRYMLQLKESVPVLTSYGTYYDAEGTRYSYDDDQGSPYEEQVDGYFYLEYANLKGNKDSRWFRKDAQP